jgi:tetratricopeptide (TPR) repeat protein
MAGEAEVIAQAEAEKQEANSAFKLKDFEGAVAGYSRAIELREHWTYLGNRAQCYIYLEKYEEAAADSERCIELNSDHGASRCHGPVFATRTHASVS